MVAASQNWETSPSYQAQSLAFLDKLASRYASSPALIAIGLLNKPTVRTRCALQPHRARDDNEFSTSSRSRTSTVCAKNSDCHVCLNAS